MKKLFSFLPILLILFSALIVPRMLAGGSSPVKLIFMGIGMILLVTLIRPKKAATRTVSQLEEEILDDYSRDAFADAPALADKFQAALSDAGKNMPKAAAGKFQKLADECTTDPQKYAVALAAAYVHRQSQDWKNVIREYNRAIVLHPTDILAYKIGDCHQRLGRLDKARDSYEFAIELNPDNPQYLSSLGTLCVGEGDYDTAIDYAMSALDLDENFPQALATLSICYGVKGNTDLHNRYKELASDNGYSREKIESTVSALKKRR